VSRAFITELPPGVSGHSEWGATQLKNVYYRRMTRIMERYPLHLRLHRALREFPRYNQFVTDAHALPLRLVESHVIVELDSSPGITVGELAQILNYDPTALSKCLHSLAQRGIVSIRPDSRDKRIRRLVLSRAGIELLRAFDQLADRQLAYFNTYVRLGPPEIKRLRDVLGQLADALCAPPSSSRDGEHPLRAAIRRLTRSFGLLGGRAMNMPLNALEWQLLLTVCEHSGRFTPSDLTGLLKVHKVALSLALKHLAKAGFISKRRDRTDTRVYYVSATAKGVRAVMGIESTAAREFAAFRDLSAQDVELVERWIRGAATFFYIDMQGLYSKRLDEPGLLQCARAAQVSYFSRNPKQPLPPFLYFDENACFGLFDQTDRLIAACEYSIDHKVVTVHNSFFDSRLHPDSARAFVLVALECHGDSQRAHVRSLEAWNTLRPSSGVASTLGSVFA
jgi:DNA-binding MarR family transcriptional regulator